MLVLLGAGSGSSPTTHQTAAGFFETDPLRVWFVYGLVVLAVLTVTLIGTRIGEAPAAAAHAGLRHRRRLLPRPDAWGGGAWAGTGSCAG